MEIGTRSVTQLLEELKAASTFGIETGDVYPHPSATLSVAVKNAEELRENPKYFAHSGGIQMLVSLGELRALRAAGAPDEKTKAYRVAFDRFPREWTLGQGMCCMDCGTEMGMSEAGSGLNPWHPINAHQEQCDSCFKKVSQAR